MADSVNPSFMGGLLAALSGGLQKQQTESGMAGLGTSPTYNMGLGLMAASAPRFGAPSGNIGEALMGAQQATNQNRAAAQQYAMGKMQQDLMMAKMPALESYYKSMGGLLGGDQGAAASNAPAPNQFLGGSAPAPTGMAMDPQRALNLGTMGSIVGAPGAKELTDYPEHYANVQKALQTGKQMSAQGPLATLDSIATSPTADKMIQGDPQLMDAWTAVAPKLGLDPKALNPANARMAATYAYNQLAGPAGLPVKPMPTQVQTVQRGLGDYRQIDPISGKDVGGASAVATDKYNIGGNVVEAPKALGVAKALTPYDPTLYGAQQITPQAMEQAYQVAKAKGDLSESLAGRDPIAAGRVSSYIAKRAGDDNVSGSKMASNQQEFGARQKVVNDFLDPGGTAGSKINAINTSVLHVGALMPLIDAMGSGNTTRINAARQAYQRETGVAAPTNYDTLANMAVGEINGAIHKTGGTEGEQKTVAAPFLSSRAPDVLKGAVKTAVTALAGKTESLANQWDVGTKGNNGNFGQHLLPQTAQALGWTLHQDAKGNKAYVSPDGKYFKQL